MFKKLELLQKQLEEKGPVTLFLIAKMDEITDKWTLIYGAPWINENNIKRNFRFIWDFLIKELQEEINKLTTKDIIMQMMISLSSLAYKKMGIPVGINDKYKDKQQAKIAVDGFDALLKVIMDEVGAEERENLKASLSNLQINFVKAFPP